MSDAEAQIAERFRLVGSQLNERQRRAFAASEARTFGWGGIAAAARACGLAENTVRKGLGELDEEPLEAGRVRKPGAGRPALEDSNPELLDALRALVAPDTRGDPERVLLWTSKSTRNLAAELTGQGHPVGFRTVPRLLGKLGFSLQSARKTLEGAQHPDRDAQFRHINDSVAAAIAAGQPAISIDTKKKELVGEFKNPGREWHPAGEPPRANTHDFPSLAAGKAIPYGVYDIADDSAMVSVGIDRDTAQFSVAAIAAWWEQFGRSRYPEARQLVITADCGGSNGNRTRLWKAELGRLAEDTGLEIVVHHFPPGTSKWNKIEHRLFSFISKNWRGRSLVSHEVIVNLIAATTTSSGLEVHARLDDNDYPTVEVTDAELAAVNLTREAFHGEWNYSIKPSSN
ncbi:MAG: ISAzo13 family transposase [Solirubrobacterales bacterium]|nr:ISAzo13 family transposase [Thermoleophilaceae bacterium]MBA3867252.1 ISAzo13 family transposase [Solirubrobacterales bacterium]